MKKNIYYLLCVVLLGFSLTGCAKETEDTPKQEMTITQVKVDELKPQTDDYSQYTFEEANLLCAIPDGFVTTDLEGEYIHQTYPKDLSSINHVIFDSDMDTTQKTQDEFESEIETEYHEAYGDDVDIKITQYDKVVIDNRPALWIMYNFDFRDERYDALMVIIYNGTESNYVTYLQGPGGEWMDKFIKSAKSLRYEAIKDAEQVN